MKETINQEKVSNISISDFTKKVYKARSEVCIKMYLKKFSNPHLCSRTFLYSIDAIRLLAFYILI